MGRPRIVVDVDALEELAAIQCTLAEMAAVLRVSPDTLSRRFSAVIEKGRERGKTSVRRAHYRAAVGGNIAAIIWWGKQYLGQRERTELTAGDGAPLSFTLALGEAETAPSDAGAA